jgi:putative Holliday junction resolvase
MRYLGLDLGSKTLGIAISDREGIIASAHETIHFKEQDEMLSEIKKIYNDNKINKIILGFPKNMNNTIGEKAKETIKFKEKLESYLNAEVILEDERWTTIQANNLLIKADLSRKKRKTKVDKLAATFILQSYLDRENRKGKER